jgi:hypothetical protein
VQLTDGSGSGLQPNRTCTLKSIRTVPVQTVANLSERLTNLVLAAAVSKTSLLYMIERVPVTLHHDLLLAYAPSIRKNRSLRIPFDEQAFEASVQAMAAAKEFKSLTVLELYHSHAAPYVGASDGTCMCPSQLPMPTNIQDSNIKPWGYRLQGAAAALADELTGKLVRMAGRLPRLRSFTITCGVIGAATLSGLVKVLTLECWTKLNTCCFQHCAGDVVNSTSDSTRDTLVTCMKRLERYESESRERAEERRTKNKVFIDPPPAMVCYWVASSYLAGVHEALMHSHMDPRSFSQFTTVRVAMSATTGLLRVLHLYGCAPSAVGLSVQALQNLFTNTSDLESLHICQHHVLNVARLVLRELAWSLMRNSGDSATRVLTMMHGAPAPTDAPSWTRLVNKSALGSLKDLHVVGSATRGVDTKFLSNEKVRKHISVLLAGVSRVLPFYLLVLYFKARNAG